MQLILFINYKFRISFPFADESSDVTDHGPKRKRLRITVE